MKVKAGFQVKTISQRRVNPVLDSLHHDPSKQLSIPGVITRVVALAQTMAEQRFYSYQVEFTSRIVESMLLHDGEVITCLMSRQSGKTTSLGAITAAIGCIFPLLAKKYPDSWHLNITDERGAYRGFAFGVKCGIYAPRLDQSNIMFDRVRHCLQTDTAVKVLQELGLTFEENNGNRILLSNGTRILCESASEQSKIEGETHQLLIGEESQDISDIKIKKSLRPMVASTMGSIVLIGTASNRKCDFYSSIKTNQRMQLLTGKQNHFFYPYTVCIDYNSLYRKYIEQEKVRLGEDSDEFRMSYKGEFIFERGMFITQDQLYAPGVPQDTGIFSTYYTPPFPRFLKHFSIVAGIDWGAASDSTAVCLMCVDWNTPLDSGYVFDAEGEHMYTTYKKHIIGFVEYHGDNYELQYNNLQAIFQEIPNLKKICMDSNTCGRPLFDRFLAEYSDRDVQIEPFDFHIKRKSEGYKLLYQDICSKRMTFPNSPEAQKMLVHQKFVNQSLDALKEYKNGYMHVDHPNEKGAHDDYLDALMLACYTANTPATSKQLDFKDVNPFYS